MLAQKKYLLAKQSDLSFEESILRHALSEYENYHSSIDKLLAPDSAYLSLIKEAISIPSDSTSTWETESFFQNPYYPEQLKYETVSGDMVRSKSELLIANALFLHKIPFRYECALVHSETTIYPDFTILNPKTKGIIYWEHFGLMDNPSYRQQVPRKLQSYIEHNIFPSINLITTFESSQLPFTPNIIEQTIAQHLNF